MNNNAPHWQRVMRISVLIYSILLSFTQLLLAGNSNGQVLNKQVSISMGRQTLTDAIQQLGPSAKVDFAYDASSLGMDKIWVRPAKYRNTHLEAILINLLAGTAIHYKEEVSGTVTLYKPQQLGRITGRVTDEQGQPLVGAGIRIAELNRSMSTDDEGGFTISVQQGTYTLEVTYVAYQSQRKTGVVVGKKL